MPRNMTAKSAVMTTSDNTSSIELNRRVGMGTQFFCIRDDSSERHVQEERYQQNASDGENDRERQESVLEQNQDPALAWLRHHTQIRFSEICI